MTSPAPEHRGPQACNTCRTRKKACDKVMPSCGYCAQRGILCSYENSSPTFRGSIGMWNQFPAPPQTTPRCEPLIRGMLNLQIESIIQSISLSCHEVSEQFFQGFHLWLPVISPRLFYTYGAASSPPPSDFSILLLAMCLITQHPADDSIYMALRGLFVQVQATICASTALVQAALLLSAYEYARGWLDAAFVSIGACARMACIIGIDERQQDKTECRPWSRTKVHENRNIWWGVVVLERVILSEIPGGSLKPAACFPSEDSLLPSDLNHPELCSLEPSLSDMESTDVSSFGRLVQASYVLNRVLQAINHTARANTKFLDLRDLDRDIQAFLIRLMKESAAIPMPHSSAITIAVRALFLLHQAILSLSLNTSNEEDPAKSSRAALDTASKMVIDAAHDHIKDAELIHAFPLCCASNIRDARMQISAVHCLADDGTSYNGLNVLIGLEKNFCAQWRPDGRL